MFMHHAAAAGCACRWHERASGRPPRQPVIRRYTVTRDGAPVALTAREFALLHTLMQRPRAVYSRQALEESLYGWDDSVGSNAVEVHIHHLRRKLGANVIENIRGQGYRLGKPA